MTLQPFMIAAPKIGLERDLEPWLLPTDAYPDLQDCFLWRGRIKKRQAYSLLGRLNRKIGTTDGGGGFIFVLPNFPLSPGSSQFIIGSQVYQDPKDTSGGDPVNLLTTGAGTGTLDRSNGTLTIAGGPALTDVFYFSGLPVMGLASLESQPFTSENIDTLVAFDTRFAYLNVNAANPFVDLSFYRGTTTVFNWTGTDYQFFWSTNYAAAMWTTNNKPGFQPISIASTVGGGDGIRWLDQDKSGWVNFAPPLTGALPNGTGTTYLLGCLIILPYKGRLICLNTYEGANLGGALNFAQRARFSQNGTPFNTNDPSVAGAPIPTFYQGGGDPLNQAWSSDITGKGGYIDAPTLEQIISADFVYDTLVVYFERSTWQLAYTGDELLPFIWVKINTELGAQSPFSIIPLDHQAIALGNVGIHSCDSINVNRIDQKIPDEVFYVQNANQGPLRVYGVRDYLNQLLYWTMPYLGPNSEQSFQTDAQPIIYPNKILVYNYVDKSYSFFNDSFTCFGYFQPQTSITWSSDNIWGEADMLWVSPADQSYVLDIVAGNQQGYVEILNQSVESFNDPALLISQITPGTPTTLITSINHNLQAGDFVQINSPSGIVGLNAVIFKVAVVIDANNFTISTPVAPTGTYTGYGQMTTVNNMSILSKRFNPFISEGTQVRLNYVDFFFENDEQGQVTVNLFINEDSSTPINSTPLTPISTISSSITAITAANPCVITVTDASSFKQNDVIFITDVLGMVQINNLGLVISLISGNNVTVSLDSSAFSAYTSLGTAWDISQTSGNIVNLFGESTFSPSPDTTLVNSKLWKRMYFQDISQFFQLQITFNDNQMMSQPIAESNTTLHGMILWFSKSGRLINA